MENQEYEEEISRIFRYKDSLIRHAEDENHVKIQYYIEKLRKMPIKFEHLDRTHIGNTVNQIRGKFDGRTKELARKCVNEWKEVVTVYETEERENAARQIELQEKAAAAAAAEEEAQKKRLMKEEQERIAAQDRKHHGEASSSHHRDSGSKHKSKRSHSGGDDHHSKKPKKDNKHHKSQDHRSSKYDDEKKKHGSDEDKHKSKSKESKDKHKEQAKKDKSKDKKSTSSSSSGSSKSKSVINVINGIDSGSGASFAEALGMCEPSGSKTTPMKKEATKKKSSSSPEKKSKSEKEKPSCSSSSHLPPYKPQTKSHHSPPSSLDLNNSLPKLLKEPIAALEPVDLNISSLLPTITPNYRPMGNLTMSDVAAKKLSDYEALSNIITSKNQRTKVYSGNKAAHGKVPSLFDMCIRILQDNIDSLEFTGGVPFHILKPILDKATPNQLYLLEHHNPYLIEDTDDMWHLHCQKDFRNKPRLELESWREMYMRCLDEREAKLIALTANIKQAQDKSVPVRKAKLAFVDDIAKPPRNIARQQARNGTGKQFDKKPMVTPSSRLSTLTSLATAGEAGKVSVPNPGARAAERSSASVNKPAKKAPLMAKSLSLLKNRFKR